GSRRIEQMNERPYPRAIAHNGKLSLEKGRDLNIVLAAVKSSIAERETARPDDGSFRVQYRVKSLAHGGHRARIQGILLGLDRAAFTRIGPTRIALPNEAANAGISRSHQQRVGALRSE